MSKYIRWLQEELDLWVRDGVISGEQRNTIRARYPAVAGVNWSRLIFSSLGGVLIGLGVILLFAYNWEAMPKFLKLGVVFSALIVAHGAGLWLRRPANGNLIASEGMHVLGTILFGAGIWLVAQIYHIDEHYPNAFIAWSGGAMLLAWALPSIAQGFIAAVLLVLWGGFEVFDFRTANHLAAIVLLATILPLAWQQRSKALTGMALFSFLLTLIFSMTRLEDELIIPVLLFWSVSFIALGLIVERSKSFPESAPVYFFWGYALHVLLLFFLSFSGAVRLIVDIKFDQPAVFWYFVVSLAIAVTLLATVIRLMTRTGLDFSKMINMSHLTVPLTLVIVMMATFKGLQGWGLMAFFNLVFLFHSMVFTVHGSRTLNVRLVTAGCVMFSVLAMSRYTDLFSSLIARSLVFFIVGAGVYATGNFYSRARKQVRGGQS